MNTINLKDQAIEELKKLLEQDDNVVDDEVNDNDVNDQFCELVCNLLHSQTQSHVYHLGTKSYVEHKALQDFYGGINKLIDNLVESYQGKFGLITNYKTFKITSYKDKKQVITYFKDLLNIIDENRSSVKNSYIQSQIDMIEELIYSTLYKLEFLD
jgi:DNA-binding ferritin-like protein